MGAKGTGTHRGFAVMTELESGISRVAMKIPVRSWGQPAAKEE